MQAQKSFFWFLDIFARFDNVELLCQCSSSGMELPAHGIVPIFVCGDHDMERLRRWIWDGEELEGLRSRRFECAICLEEPDEVYSLKCGHLFDAL